MKTLPARKKIASGLSISGAALAVLTVATAWGIQTFSTYYSWGDDFYAWIGRALWCAIGLTMFALVFGWVGTPWWRNITRTVLAIAIAAIGLNLEFAPKTRAEGDYYFSTNWVDRNVDNWQTLFKPIAGKPGLRALEIGSFEGRSAIWFLNHVLTDPSSSITCIDVFMGASYEANFDHNVKSFGQKVVKIKAPSFIALRNLKLGSYDFAYIDGSHFATDVLIDAVLTWDLIKPGGMIIFDDYGEEYAKGQANPKLAIDAFMQVMGPNVDILHKGYQLVIRKRAV